MKWFAQVCLVLSVVLAGSTAQAIPYEKAVNSLLDKLRHSQEVGEVLFQEDFEAASLDKWSHSDDVTIVNRPDGTGKCLRIVNSGEHKSATFILKNTIPISADQPVIISWKTRYISGDSDRFWLRIDSHTEDHKTKTWQQPRALSRDKKWTYYDLKVTGMHNDFKESDWFVESTQSISLHVFVPQTSTRTEYLLDDIRVVDLEAAALELVTGDVQRQITGLERVKEEIATIASSSVNDEWKDIVLAQCGSLLKELQTCLNNNPRSPEFDGITEKPLCYARRLTDAAAGLRNGTVTGKLLTYSTELFPPEPITPYTAELPGKISHQLQLVACAGEYESASLVLWAPEPLSPLVIKATSLQGPGGIIPASDVDIKYVKCWRQRGCYVGPGYLVPELLLNDDALVNVDYEQQQNYIKLSFPGGSKYVPDYESTRLATVDEIELEKFPVQDADSLQPLDLPAGENKQVWITVKVPSAAKAGNYRGRITLSVNGKEIVKPITLTVKVPAFELASPKTHYDLSQDFFGSLYYWGRLDSTGKGMVGFATKSEEQFRAELKLLADHGIVAPCMVLPARMVYGNRPLFRQHLAIMREYGMSGRPLYLGSEFMTSELRQQEGFDALKDNIRKTIAIAREYGFTEVYFYGSDEATGERLTSQRPAWQAVHEAGGKVIVSGSPGHFDAVGDLLDLIVFGANPNRAEASRWHNLGQKIFNYSHPPTCIDNAIHYRHNYGLYLWKLDFDGPCSYCFIDTPNSWNDFDFTRGDCSIAYPTHNGVIGTLALEGYREAIDDVKYATTLLMEIDKASRKNSLQGKQKADEARQWLENIDTRNVNLDDVRSEMIRRILELKKSG